VWVWVDDEGQLFPGSFQESRAHKHSHLLITS
jgi:hypothetical protein